ncbi:hypothetical protein Slin14017_G068500 [Septoria linicola]|nr:hypothetical protein Slin14017_G068500 [Septoria linicola]
MTGFLDLPAELRNRVYELIVTRNQVIPLSKVVGAAIVIYSNPAREDSMSIFPRLPALSGVSRQVRTEALAIFYGSNTFTAHSHFETKTFIQRLDSRSLTMLRDVRATTYQISALKQIVKPNLHNLVNYYARGFLSNTAAKVPLRTKRIGRGGRNEDFEVAWVSLADLDLWERDPRDIDMVRRVTLLSRY